MQVFFFLGQSRMAQCHFNRSKETAHLLKWDISLSFSPLVSLLPRLSVPLLQLFIEEMMAQFWLVRQKPFTYLYNQTSVVKEGAGGFFFPFSWEEKKKRKKKRRGDGDNTSFLLLLENSIRKISESMTPMNE